MSRLIPRRRARGILREEDGATAVEFAIVFPVFFLLLFTIFELARLVWTVNSLQYAVAQGARYVTMSPSGNSKPTTGTCASPVPDNYKTAVQTYLQKQLTAYRASAIASVPLASVSCGTSTSPPTVTITVKATYDFNFILSSLVASLGTLTLQQQATVTTPLI
jgi:Flp pilus assembly protein TadG